MMPGRPEVVHEDEHLLVLCKPAGLLCVPGRGEDKQDCLSLRAQVHWPDALVVHRLDMATSGLVLMARSPTLQKTLSQAFAERRIDKLYEAVVHGQPGSTPEAGWQCIDLPLRIDWPNRPRSRVDPELGKPSQTLWRELGPGPLPGTRRLALRPLTGRTHQLRLHCQAQGWPLLGDALYAPPEVQALSPRLLLHACQLAFTHPVTGQTLRLHSPVPF